MPQNSKRVHGEAVRITGQIPMDKPCFVISCNRGEIANDTLRAAKENMHPAVFTAAIHTIGDRQYGYVHQSEFKMCIGPDSFNAEERAAGRATTPYMDIPILFTAFDNIRNEAARMFGEGNFQIGVHPGYGMLSEDPEFVENCLKEGYIFIGPGHTPQSMMGPKDSARDLAVKSGLQVVPGAGDIKTLEDAQAAHAQIIKDNPELKDRRFRLKAVAGGGGRGQIVFQGTEELPEKFAKVQQVSAGLGWPSHFVMELNIEVSRHYEIQMFRDLTFFGRECSLMRNHQKEIEEFLSPDAIRAKDPEAAKQLQKMIDAAPNLARECGLDSVATLECIYDEQAKKLYFLEMNTRIQVEHPVSNAATGVDLLRAQILHSFGAPIILKQEEVVAMGHSIEARITNLDPYDPNFGPLGGKKVDRYWPPERTDRIRHYGYITSGNSITSFDPMFAKIVGRGHDRKEAIESLFRGLSEFMIEGHEFRHNIPHQLFVICHPKFIEHNYNSETMDEIRKEFLEKFVPFFDENYGKENRYNNPVVAEAVNNFYDHDFH
jgi:acetyl/propionyl-CoA carboxylase alpha subunit